MYMDEVNNKIKPTDDFIFKRLFGVEENKDILIAFLNALFDEYDCFQRIIDLEYKNNEITKKNDDNRSCRLDVRAKINDDTYVDIEVQTEDTGNLINRSVFYNSMMMVDSVDEGNKMDNVPKVISIWIVKDKLREDNKFKDYKSPIVMTNIKSEDTKFGDKSEVISDKFNIIFIFLSKFKEGMLNKNLENWLKFIDNQNVTEVKDDEIMKANGKMNIFRGDKVMKAIYEAKLKARFDKIEYINEAHDKGLQQGREEGREEGIEIGREEGREEGLKEKSIEIAKNMLKKVYKIEDISELSSLSVNEINNLKN